MLDRLLKDAPDEDVTLAWLIAGLRERSFGIVMLILGLVALIPGASGVVGVLLMIPAVQMMFARKGPAFPGFLARRRISKRKLARLVARINPILHRIERVVRPRCATPFEATKMAVGLVVLLLAATLLAPIPFSNIIPGLVIVLLSFAYIEEDGIALCIALVAALVSLAIVAATVWAALRGIDFLDRL
ncbi:MAG: exopolysaccharide biosynthesis protein [Alphaproteobacteria bacterium]